MPKHHHTSLCRRFHSFPVYSNMSRGEFALQIVFTAFHSISAIPNTPFLASKSFPYTLIYKGFPMQLLKQILTCFQLQFSCYKVPGRWFSALHLEPLDARHQNGTMATFNQEVFIQTTPRKNGHQNKEHSGM